MHTRHLALANNQQYRLPQEKKHFLVWLRFFWRFAEICVLDLLSLHFFSGEIECCLRGSKLCTNYDNHLTFARA